MSSHHAPVWPIYKRLLGYTRTYWVFMIGAVIAMVVEALAGYHFTKLMEPLVNRGFVNPEPRMAVILPLTILGLFLMRSVATWVSDYTLPRPAAAWSATCANRCCRSTCTCHPRISTPKRRR